MTASTIPPASPPAPSRQNGPPAQLGHGLFNFPPFSALPLLLLVALKPLADAFYEVDAVKYGYMLALAFSSLLAVAGRAISRSQAIGRPVSLIPYLFLIVFYFLYLFELTITYPGYIPEIFKVLSPFVFFFLVAVAMDRWMLSALAIGAVLTICVNAALLPIDFGWTAWGGARTFKGYYFFKTDLAYALCFAVLIFGLYSRNSITPIVASFAALAAIQIVLSNSRLNYLTFVIVVAFFASKANLRLRSILPALLFLGFVLAIFSYLYDPATMVGFDTSNEEGFTQGRSVIWKHIFDSIATNTPVQWFFGRGMFADLLLSAGNLSLTNGMAHNAHDEYLHLLYTQGIFGTAVYIVLWVAMYRHSRSTKLPTWAHGTAAIAIVIFLMQGATTVMSSFATKTWPLAMLFLAVRAVALESSMQSSNSAQ